MFENPSAKRVKRSELFDDVNSEDELNTHSTIRAPDSIETAIAALDYSFEYEFVDQTGSDATPYPQPHSTTKDADVFAFNLFRPTSKPANTTATRESETQPDTPKPSQGNLISIRSPSPTTTGDPAGGFNRARPESDYFTSALPAAVQRELKKNYTSSAISASRILALSRMPWPGASLPLRVIALPAHRQQIVVHKAKSNVSRDSPAGSRVMNGAENLDASHSENAATCRRRPRPSKKRRLLLTARSRHRQMLIDETKTKEAHEREKKNQKNRERKMKRRAKERREKAERAQTQEVDI